MPFAMLRHDECKLIPKWPWALGQGGGMGMGMGGAWAIALNRSGTCAPQPSPAWRTRASVMAMMLGLPQTVSNTEGGVAPTILISNTS